MLSNGIVDRTESRSNLHSGDSFKVITSVGILLNKQFMIYDKQIPATSV